MAVGRVAMADWYVNEGDKTHGPFSSNQLKQLAAKSKINADTQVRLGADGEWIRAKHVKGLCALQPVAAAAPTSSESHLRRPIASDATVAADVQKTPDTRLTGRRIVPALFRRAD